MITINNHEISNFKTLASGDITYYLPTLYHDKNKYVVKAHLSSSDAILELIFLTKALKSYFRDARIELVIHYLPYCHEYFPKLTATTAAARESIFGLIDELGFDKVTYADSNHPVNIKNSNEITLSNIFDTNKDILFGMDAIVSPYKLLNNRVEEIGAKFKLPVIYASPVSNLTSTTERAAILSNHQLIKNANILIIDNRCNTGDRVIALTKLIKGYKSKSITYYATHGIFSENFVELVVAGIRKIYTTDSYQCAKWYPNTEEVGIIKLPNNYRNGT